MRLTILMVRNLGIAAFICLAAGAAERYIGFSTGGLVFISFPVAALCAFVERLDQ